LQCDVTHTLSDNYLCGEKTIIEYTATYTVDKVVIVYRQPLSSVIHTESITKDLFYNSRNRATLITNTTILSVSIHVITSSNWRTANRPTYVNAKHASH